MSVKEMWRVEMWSILILTLISHCLGYKNNEGSIYVDNNWKSLGTIDKEPSLPLQTSDNWKYSTTEIFISISNFIDSERCASSLHNYISKAQYPQRLKFGLFTSSLTHFFDSSDLF